MSSKLQTVTIQLDDDVWAECQRLGKEHGTINEGMAAAQAALRMLPLAVVDGMTNRGRGNQNPDQPFSQVVTKEIKRQVQSRKRGLRPKGDRGR